MDDRRQRRRYALVAGVLGVPGAACAGAGATLLVATAAWEGARWPALLGLACWLALIAWAVLSWRYLRRGREGLRAGRWPFWDRSLWALLILGLIAAGCMLAMSGLLVLGGLMNGEPGMMATGALLLLFGPALMWPVTLLLQARAGY
ncbi:MAG: hypothetical protein ACK4FW_08290 [Stenotrophomonas sp.]